MIRPAIVGGMCLGAVLLAGAWMMFQRIPPWYRPTDVAAARLQEVKNDLVGTFERFSDLMNGEQPFRFRLTQEQVNAWLAARREIWPPAQRWVPPEMDAPFIAFEADGAVVAATVSLGSVRTVLSATVSARVEADRLAVRVRRVRAGALAVPDAWVRRRLAMLGPRGRADAASGRAVPELAELMGGARLPADYHWPNPKRRFRLVSVRFEPGALVVEIQPLERRAAP